MPNQHGKKLWNDQSWKSEIPFLKGISLETTFLNVKKPPVTSQEVKFPRYLVWEKHFEGLKAVA